MRVAVPLLAMILSTLFLCHLHRPLPAAPTEETTSYSQSTALKKDDQKLGGIKTRSGPNSATASDDWSWQIIADIHQALNSTNEADHKEIITHLFPTLLSRDPAAAADLAKSVEPVPLREELFRQVARVWSQSDPDRALEWASHLNDSGERANALTLVCSGIAETSPLAAMEDAQRVGLDHDAEAMESLVQVWAARDLENAVRWTMQLPASDTRDQMLALLAFNQTLTDPARAATLVAEQIPQGPTQDEAAISVLHQWALQDPTGAVAWLQKFPLGPLRDRGMQELSGIATINN